MDVINYEHTYRNGVVVMLHKRDIEKIKWELNYLESIKIDTCPEMLDLVRWIIRELE